MVPDNQPFEPRPRRIVDLVSDADPGHGSGDDDPSVFVLDEQRFDGSLSSTDEESPGLKTVLFQGVAVLP